MVVNKERQWTWARARKLIIDNEGHTLGSWLDYYYNYVPMPENNRTLISKFDREKLNYMLERDGFNRLPELTLQGDAANLYCKEIFTDLLAKLKAVGLNVVDAGLIHKFMDDGIVSDEGALEWLDEEDFKDDVLGISLIIEGTKHKRLYARFNVDYSFKYHYTHKEEYASLLEGMDWHNTTRVDVVGSFVRGLLVLLHEFDIDFYYNENFNEDEVTKKKIYWELQEDLADMVVKCERLCDKLNEESNQIRERVYGL